MYHQPKHDPKEVFVSQKGLQTPFLRPEDLLHKDTNGKYRLIFYAEKDQSSHLIIDIDADMTMGTLMYLNWEKRKFFAVPVLRHLCYAGSKPSVCPCMVNRAHLWGSGEVLCRSFIPTEKKIFQLAKDLDAFRESEDVVEHRVQLCLETEDGDGTFSSSNIEYNPGRMSGSSEWSCIQRDAYEYVRSSEFVLKDRNHWELYSTNPEGNKFLSAHLQFFDRPYTFNSMVRLFNNESGKEWDLPIEKPIKQWHTQYGIFILFPCIGENIDKYFIKHRENCTAEAVEAKVKQLLLGVQKLHDRDFALQNLSCQNVVCDDKGMVQIADVSASVYLPQTEDRRVAITNDWKLCAEIIGEICEAIAGRFSNEQSFLETRLVANMNMVIADLYNESAPRCKEGIINYFEEKFGSIRTRVTRK